MFIWLILDFSYSAKRWPALATSTSDFKSELAYIKYSQSVSQHPGCAACLLGCLAELADGCKHGVLKFLADAVSQRPCRGACLLSRLAQLADDFKHDDSSRHRMLAAVSTNIVTGFARVLGLAEPSGSTG